MPMQRFLVIISLITLPLEALARGGGGGSSGGGSGGGFNGGYHGSYSNSDSQGTPAESMSSFVGFLWLAFIVAVIFFLVRQSRLSQNSRAATKEINDAAQKDAAWEPSKLTERASSLFLAYQDAWCKDDTTWIETLATSDFAERTVLKMDVLRNMKREDVMTGTKILSMSLDSAHDDNDNAKDLFVMRIIASADDRLMDKEENKQLFREDGVFIEYWTFNRVGNDWRIAGVRQETEDLTQTHSSIENFAQENNLFYEPDFGWLMLPTKGELFKKNKLGTSDINDHVIGKHRGKIVEFYTMRAYNGGPNWLVAQAILPISHFDVLVRPKKFLQITPRGMKHHQTESNAFDKIFTVDSDPKDNITTFELLVPDFMQYMIDLPFELTIEVVGNTLYFATPDIDKADHPEMLRLLDRAFDSMKM